MSNAFIKIFLFFIFIFSGFSIMGQSDSLRYLSDKAYAASEAGNFTEALKSLKKILIIDSNNIWAIDEQIYVYGEQKNYAEIIKSYNHLIRIVPKNANYWNDAGWFSILNKNFFEAEKYCLKALELNNCSYSIYLNLGHIYGYLKKRNNLENYYQKAANYIPNREIFEKNILPDFDLLESFGDFPYYTAPYKNWFVDYFNNEYLKKAYGSTILDSVYKSVCIDGYSAHSDLVIELKERFLKEELKNKHLRLFVMRDFFMDLGWVHYFDDSKNYAINNYFMNVIKISHDLNDTSMIIDMLYQLGDVSTEGTFLLNQALDLAIQTHNVEKQFEINLILGDKLSQQHKSDSALIYFRQCLYLSDFLKDEALNLSVDRLMKIFSEQKRLDSVQYYYQFLKSINSIRVESFESEYHNDFHYCNMLCELSPKEAIRNGKAFIKQYQSYKTKNISDIYEIIGLAYNQIMKTDSAEFYFNKATVLYLNYMRDNPNLKLDFPLKARNISYLNLKRIALDKRNIKELFNLSEQTKANVLYPKLTGNDYPAKSIDLETLKKSLKDDELALSYSNSFMINEAYGIAISKEGFLLEKENYILIDSLAKVHKDVNWESYLSKIDVALNVEEQGELKTGSLLAIVVSRNLENLMRGGETRGAKVVSGNKRIDVSAELLAFNDILYQIYVKPFEQRLVGKRTLYISTDLLSALIPFEVIKNDKGQYLGSLYNIVYVPSFTVREILKSKTKANNNKMLALGNPEYSKFEIKSNGGRSRALIEAGLDNWGNLPGTKRELEAIQQIATDVMVLDSLNVSETKVKSLSTNGEMARFNILHFAVHGIGSINDYKYNSLIVSEKNGSKEDGFLQYDEIKKLNINADLVCLSACETVVGLPSESEEVKNLPVAFFLAGAHSVIGTWWKVDDDATGIFMGSFYNFVFSKNKSYSEALHLTRQKFISGEFGEKYKVPYYWAAFKYFGN